MVYDFVFTFRSRSAISVSILFVYPLYPLYILLRTWGCHRVGAVLRYVDWFFSYALHFLVRLMGSYNPWDLSFIWLTLFFEFHRVPLLVWWALITDSNIWLGLPGHRLLKSFCCYFRIIHISNNLNDYYRTSFWLLALGERLGVLNLQSTLAVHCIFGSRLQYHIGFWWFSLDGFCLLWIYSIFTIFWLNCIV